MATTDNSRTGKSEQVEVTRSFRLPSLQSEADAAAASRACTDQPGVVDTEVDLRRKRLTIRYQVRSCDYQTLEQCLEESGHPTAQNWWARVKSDWFQNLDLNARENAAAPPPACCNKPPPGARR